MNYGETLSYWYLRLNGFFPLRNFVMHMKEDRAQRSDCDILAVRFPRVSEDIGGQPSDWDEKRFDEWGVSLERPIVLIVQVKTGGTREPGNAFRPERLRHAVRRVGLWSADEAAEVADRLAKRPLVVTGDTTVAKLLIASRPSQGKTYLSMALDEATGFIRRRFEKYADHKSPDRLFFSDELIQFFAHQAGVPQVEVDGAD